MKSWLSKFVLLTCALQALALTASSQDASKWHRGRANPQLRTTSQSGNGSSKRISPVSRRADSTSAHAAEKSEVDHGPPAVVPAPAESIVPVPSVDPQSNTSNRVPEADALLDPAPLRAAPENDTDIRKQQKDRRYKELQDRIRALIKKEQGPVEERSAPTEGHEPPVTPSTEEHPEQTPADHGGDQESGGHLEQKPKQEPEHAPADDTNHADTHVAEPTLSDAHNDAAANDLSAVGHRMVDSPIDRVSLANNLYVVGEFGLALRMYESIDGTSLSADDENWVRLQIAGCLRKLGRRAEAQQKYRQLAAKPEAGQINELARWWLQQMNERTALEEDLKRYENVIRIQKESIDAAGATE